MSTKNKVKRLLILGRDIALVVLLVWLVSLWQGRNMLAVDSDVPVPAQKLVSLAGKIEPLLATDAQTLIYFFAPWCGVCALSIDNLEGLESDQLRVVRVALDYQQVNEVEQFVADNQVQGEVLLGNDALKQHFQISGYPAYYLVDSNQKVVAKSFGYSTELGLRLTAWLN